MKSFFTASFLMLGVAGLGVIFAWKESAPSLPVVDQGSVITHSPAKKAKTQNQEIRKSGSPETMPSRKEALRNIDQLLSGSAELPDLCRLRCEEIEPVLRQIHAYQDGVTPPLERDDPAYLLAKVLFQRAMGKSGKAVIKTMILFQDPSWVKALSMRPREMMDLVAVMNWHLTEMENEAGEQARMADEFVESLKFASSSCEERIWTDTCQRLKWELLVWNVQ